MNRRDQLHSLECLSGSLEGTGQSAGKNTGSWTSQLAVIISRSGITWMR